jgi:hypothetical protein
MQIKKITPDLSQAVGTIFRHCLVDDIPAYRVLILGIPSSIDGAKLFYTEKTAKTSILRLCINLIKFTDYYQQLQVNDSLVTGCFNTFKLTYADNYIEDDKVVSKLAAELRDGLLDNGTIKIEKVE